MHIQGTVSGIPPCSHSQLFRPELPLDLKNNNNTNNKVASEALPTDIIAGPYADTLSVAPTFTNASTRHDAIYPWLEMKKKNTARMRTESDWWGEVRKVGEVGNTRREVGVAPTGTTTVQTHAKISQLNAKY